MKRSFLSNLFVNLLLLTSLISCSLLFPNKKVSTPIIFPEGGNFTESVTITIKTATDDAIIRYTTDNSIPSITKGEYYTVPFAITKTTIIKAIAFDRYMENSIVATETYILNNTALPTIPTDYIYFEDFSYSPGWITSDLSQFYWNESQQTYNISSININYSGNYAVKKLNINMASRSYKLEYDMLLISVGYACGIGFGLYDTDLNAEEAGSYVSVVFVHEDRGYVIFMLSRNVNNQFTYYWLTDKNNFFSLNQWYHVIMEYNATTSQITTSVSIRNTGNTFTTFSMTGGNFATDMDCIGTSNIRSGSYSVPGATAQAYIDNVKIVIQ